MNQKELKELIDFLIEKDITEFELERGDVKVRIKRGAEHATVMPNHFVAVPSPVVAAPVAAETPHAAPPATPTRSGETTGRIRPARGEVADRGHVL